MIEKRETFTNFLKLTEAKSGTPVFINMKQIAIIIRQPLANSTLIVVAGGVTNVTETPEEILGIEKKEG